jgi:DNA-binding MarR family transcriptional regulator
MTIQISLDLEDKILSDSKVMVNILPESLIQAKVQGLPAPQFHILDMVYHCLDKPADAAKMLDVSHPAMTRLLEPAGMGKDVVRR